MTNDEFKSGRETLSLTQAELAGWLGLTGGSRSVRKYEASPGHQDHRPVSGPVARLMEAFLEGWRPPCAR